MILLKLFFTFFKIGLFTFGGGYAMLPLVQAEVIKNGWLSNAEFINFVAISESTPGPFAINISTFVGSEVNGFLGALFSTLGVVLPSFIVILIVASFFEKFKTNKIVSYCMNGLKPAVIGLIGAAVISMGKTVLFNDVISLEAFKEISFYISIAIFAVMTFLSFKKVHPILIIVLSAILGIVSGYIIY